MTKSNAAIASVSASASVSSALDVLLLVPDAMAISVSSGGCGGCSTSAAIGDTFVVEDVPSDSGGGDDEDDDDDDGKRLDVVVDTVVAAVGVEVVIISTLDECFVFVTTSGAGTLKSV
jgi:hypothetical protein